MPGEATKRPFTLWASPVPPPTDLHAAALWDQWEDRPGLVSLLREVESRSDGLRAIYREWVEGIGDLEVDGRTVVRWLALDDGPSHWWMTLLVEKNPSKTYAVVDSLRLLALEELLVESQASSLHLVGGDRRLGEAVRLLAADLGVGFQWNRRLRTVRRRRRAGWLGGRIRGLLGMARFLFLRLPIITGPPARWPAGRGEVLVCSQMMGVGSDSDGRAECNIWLGLRPLMEDLGIESSRLHLWAPTSSVPSARVARRLVEANRRAHGSEAENLVLSHLDLRLLGRAWRRWLAIGRVARGLGGIPQVLAASGRRPWLWTLHRDDWTDSTTGDEAFRACLMVELFDSALASMPRHRLLVYAYEFHAWERALLAAWRRNGHGTAVAYGHSTIRYWDLRYHQRIPEPDGEAPFPDYFMVTGDGARDVLLGSGVPASMLVEGEAIRYLGLSGAEGRSGREAMVRDDGPIRVLVCTEYLGSTTRSMLDVLEGAGPLVGRPLRVVVRPHPGSPDPVVPAPALGSIRSTSDLLDDLAEADVVIVGGWTSTVVEAVQVGCPVVVLLATGDLDFTPVRGLPGVRRVTTAAELAEALDHPEGSALLGWPEGWDFIHLDPDLPRWRRLLLERTGEADPEGPRSVA